MDLTPQQVEHIIQEYLDLDAVETYMARLQHTVMGWLGRIGEWSAVLRDEHPFLFILFLLALFGVLGFLIWHIVYTVRGVLRASRELDVAPPEEPATTHRDHLDAAERLADEGAHMDAIRRLLLCGAWYLDEESIAYRRTETNREYLVRLRRERPEAAAILEEVAALVDHKWYGMVPATAEDYRRAREHIRELVGR